MFRNCLIKPIVFILLICLVLKNTSKSYPYEEEEKVYRPYPVIFVHGYGGKRDDWSETINKLRPYYEKYDFTDEEQYFPYYDYRGWFHEGCIANAPILKQLIWRVLYRMGLMTPPVPKSKRKVIIVCHSLGGLLTRYMLNTLNSSYVYKVIFVGTPHKGTPWASCGWLIYDNTKENSNLRMIQKWFKRWSENVTGALSKNEARAYNDLAQQIQEVLEWDERFVRFSRRLLNILLEKPAIEETRVPSDIECKTKLEGVGGFFPWSLVKIPYIHVNKYDGDKTFLYDRGHLATPENRRSIIGTGGWIIGPLWEFFLWNIIFFSPHSFTNFPPGNSLGDLGPPGDGVVTYISQTALGKDYLVNISHGKETKQWQTILIAIDDEPPEITKIEAVPLDWKGWNSDKQTNLFNRDRYYIVIGIKEYLLADIEIMDLTLDDKSIIEGKSSKPYEWYKNKEFLRGRKAPFMDKDGNAYKLKPGEFYIGVKMGPGIHTLKIKVKNPAKKIASAKKKFSRPWIEGEYFAAGDFPWTIDLPTYDQYEDKDGDGIPGPDIVPEVGGLSFTANTDVSEPGAPKAAKITAGVYVYKHKKYKKKIKKQGCGGPTEAEVEVITPVPDKPIYSFVSGIYSLNGGEYKFSDLVWDGSGNKGEGDKYPVFIKVELLSNKNIQGLLYTNWQDNKGWDNDVILGDPTFIQVSNMYTDKYEFALYEIARTEREYKKQIQGLVDWRLYSDVDISRWIAKLRANGASNEDVEILLIEREKDIYEQLKEEISHLEQIKNTRIESIWLDLLVEIQLDNNRLWLDNLQKHLTLVINQPDKIPYNNLHLNSISGISIIE